MTAPGYWTNEASGRLAEAVHAFLHASVHGTEMTPEHVALMRAYVRQWIAADWQGPPGAVDGLRRDVDTIRDMRSCRAWLDRAADIGIDPL